jgi:hypothetical protein
MQNPRATTSLKPGGCDVNIEKYLSQMNICPHHLKWKSPIFGVAQIVLRDVFLASIFLAYVEPKLFFTFARENSPVQPLLEGHPPSSRIHLPGARLFVAFKTPDYCSYAGLHRRGWNLLLGGCIPNDPTCRFPINHSLWGPYLPAATMAKLISDFGLRGGSSFYRDFTWE